jgi:hypothetical protein
MALNGLLKRELKFSLDMWGYQGFQLAHSQAVRSKQEIKGLYNDLEEWANLLEFISKICLKMQKTIPFSSNACKTQEELYFSLCELSRNQGNWCRGVNRNVKLIAGALRVLK